MVDYILKIDIDESALVRKLNAALKKVQMPGVATGQSGQYQASMGGFAKTMAQGGQGATLTEPGMKRVAEAAQVQADFRAGQRNTLLLDNDLKLFRENQKFQHGMKRLAQVQGNWTAKMFNVGTIVKLAGLATGVAGLLQFRKILIESSPMLQAMLKILNVAVMFILRPIGDFIGFVLRPLLIPFLKFAISYYASRLGIIIETGDELGNALLKGDFMKALDRLILFGTIIANPEKAKIDLEARQESELAGETGFDDFLNVLKTLFFGGVISTGITLFEEWGRSITGFYNSIEQPSATVSLMKATPGFLGGISLFVANLAKLSKDLDTSVFRPWENLPLPEKEEEDKDYTSFDAWLEAYGKKPKEEEGTLYKRTMEDSASTSDKTNQYAGFEDMYREMEVQRIAEAQRQEAIMNKQLEMEARAVEILEVIPKGIQMTAEVMALLESNLGKVLYPGGGIGTQADVDKLAQRVEEEDAYLTALEKYDDGTQRATEKIKVWRQKVANSTNELEQQTKALRYNTEEQLELADSAARASAALNSIQGFIGGAAGGAGGSGGGSGSPYLGQGGSGGFKGANGKIYGTEQEARDNNPPGSTVTPMAEGGLIDEEIWGVGRRTGKFYKMGEQGDEMVIPWSSASSDLDNLKRIGFNPDVSAEQRAPSRVGKFTGISAGRYGRYLANLDQSRQRQQMATSGLAEYDEANPEPWKRVGRYTSRRATGQLYNIRRFEGWINNPKWKEWQQNRTATGFQEEIKSSTEDISRWSTAASPYEGQVSAEKLMSSQKTYETTGEGGINQNSITINVAKAENADDLIAQLGDKLLQFLQDNDARVGIR